MIVVDLDTTFAEAAFKALNDRLTDLSPVMNEIGEQMVASTRERFFSGQSPDGTPWAPKQPSTIEAFARREGYEMRDFRPLWGATGDLRTLFSYYADGENVTFGTNVIYAAVHQFGAAKGAFGFNRKGRPIPWGDIPARPFIGFSSEDELMIAQMLDDWLQTATDQ